jgi:hypothetical protein
MIGNDNVPIRGYRDEAECREPFWLAADQASNGATLRWPELMTA